MSLLQSIAGSVTNVQVSGLLAQGLVSGMCRSLGFDSRVGKLKAKGS